MASTVWGLASGRFDANSGAFAPLFAPYQQSGSDGYCHRTCSPPARRASGCPCRSATLPLANERSCLPRSCLSCCSGHGREPASGSSHGSTASRMKRSARRSNGRAKRAGSTIRSASMRQTSGTVLGRLAHSTGLLPSGSRCRRSPVCPARRHAPGRRAALPALGNWWSLLPRDDDPVTSRAGCDAASVWVVHSSEGRQRAMGTQRVERSREAAWERPGHSRTRQPPARSRRTSRSRVSSTGAAQPAPSTRTVSGRTPGWRRRSSASAAGMRKSTVS